MSRMFLIMTRNDDFVLAESISAKSFRSDATKSGWYARWTGHASWVFSCKFNKPISIIIMLNVRDA